MPPYFLPLELEACPHCTGSKHGIVFLMPAMQVLALRLYALSKTDQDAWPRPEPLLHALGHPQFPIPCPALSSFLFLCAVRVLPNEMAGTGLHSVPCMLGSVLGVLGRHSFRASANQGHCKRRGMPWTAVPAPPIQEGRVCDQQATRGKCFCHSSIARCTPRFKSAASHRPPGPTAGSTCSLPLYQWSGCLQTRVVKSLGTCPSPTGLLQPAGS